MGRTAVRPARLRAESAVLLINPRSGDGKAERVGLVRECRARASHRSCCGRGDVVALAEAAVARGADLIGGRWRRLPGAGRGRGRPARSCDGGRSCGHPEPPRNGSRPGPRRCGRRARRLRYRGGTRPRRGPGGRLRADAGYFAGQLARAALFADIEFAIGARRIAPLWRLLDGIAETDWTHALDMPAAQVAVADYGPNWWPAATRLLIRRVPPRRRRRAGVGGSSGAAGRPFNAIRAGRKLDTLCGALPGASRPGRHETARTRTSARPTVRIRHRLPVRDLRPGRPVRSLLLPAAIAGYLRSTTRKG